MDKPSHSLLRWLAVGGSALCIEALHAAGTMQAAPSATDGHQAKTLDTVTVQGTQATSNGLRVDAAQLGPLGSMSRLDTPYTVNVVPQALIDDQQLKSIADALRYLPSVQGDGVRPQSRGVQGSVVQNSRIDGLNAVSTTDYPIEQFDRIEVLNGPAGALYGPANPSGSFDYILKRPTEQRLNRFTLGYSTASRRLAQADLAGPIGPLGYRVILLNEHGGNYTDGSRLRRQLANLALDYHFSPDTVLESNFSHYRYVSKGLPATFALAAGVHFPSPLDPARAAYAVRSGGNDNTTDTGSLEFRHAFSDQWRLSVGLLRQIADRESTGPTNTLINQAGAYRTTIATGAASRFTITSNTLYLNGKVHTGEIEHALTFGNSGFDWNNYNPRNGGTATLGAASLAHPQSFPLIGVPDFTRRYQSAAARQQSLIVGDDLTFSPRWSALLVASQSWLASHNYNLRGVQISRSSNDGVSSAASLVFKPQWNMSTYLSYADSLQQGDTAPVGSSNAGSILAPFRSKQWELGYKLALDKLNLSVAAFQIKRPFAFTRSDGVFGVAGQQRNRGVELMTDGQVNEELSLFGGVAWLDPKLFDTGNAATEGKRIVGLAHATANLLAEYRPRALPGLSTSINVHYVSARPTDNANLHSVSAYTTLDVGLGYRMTVRGQPVTYLLNINNLTNRRYWTNIVPGGLNGYTGAGNASASPGAPRAVVASVQFQI
ncbi:TonB-dependent receptor [Frateuria defendens]|uniref:TonB-dependent receptor n=1 Tax=Frateuria defendens TaxID=2219559 RepID=UPI000A4BCDBB|nr:TonB-dependent siderophore receptor [Frateuria defendens]